MEKGVQYQRELAMLEMMYNIDLDKQQLSQDPDDVKFLWPIWQKCVLSSPSLYANTDSNDQDRWRQSSSAWAVFHLIIWRKSLFVTMV